MQVGSLVAVLAGMLAAASVTWVAGWFLPMWWAVPLALFVACVVMLGVAWLWDYTRERRHRETK